MRIAKVEGIPVAYPEPNDFTATRYLCLVKITTDDGIVGWGESITQGPEANRAVAAILEGTAEVIIGRDPMHIEAIWHSMKDAYSCLPGLPVMKMSFFGKVATSSGCKPRFVARTSAGWPATQSARSIF